MCGTVGLGEFRVMDIDDELDSDFDAGSKEIDDEIKSEVETDTERFVLDSGMEAVFG